MVLLILLCILLGYFIYKNKQAVHFDDEKELQIAFTTIGIALVALVMACGQLETRSMPEERQSLQETYDNARQHTSIERVAVTSNIADFNQKLAKAKYWNSTFLFDSFVSDRVESVDPIE